MGTGKQPRMTQTRLAVLRVFLEEPDQARYGLEIGRAAGVRSGSLYPILDDLERAGMLTSEWEDIDPHSAGRPRRRHYLLTGQGVTVATAALREAQERLVPKTWRTRFGDAAC